MAGKFSMAARAEVTAAIRERYRASGKAAKGAILDEFVAVTGVHRKHAILSARRILPMPWRETRVMDEHARFAVAVEAGEEPVVALAAIRAAQAELGQWVDRRGTGPIEAEAPIVIDIAAALESAARSGEQRPIHRRPYRRVKPIPKRPSKLDPHRSEIGSWLDSEPAITAVEVLARLRARHPDRFTKKHSGAPRSW